MTAAVKPATDTRCALLASEVYAGRIIAGLYEVVALFRTEQSKEARELLKNSVSGIHCLVDLLAAVDQLPGGKVPAATDHAIGAVALGLNAIDIARLRGDHNGIVTAIEHELVPALSRLVPSFHLLESRLRGHEHALPGVGR